MSLIPTFESTSRHINLPTDVCSHLDHVPGQEYKLASSGATNGKVSADGSLAVVTKGSRLDVIHLATNERLASWTCSVISQEEVEAEITCLETFSVDDCSPSHVLVGLDCGPEGGLVVLFNIPCSKVIRAIALPRPVTTILLIAVEGGPSVPGYLNAILRYFFGILAVGTSGGRVYLVDLALDLDTYCGESDPQGLFLVDPYQTRDIARIRREQISRNHNLGLDITYTINKPDYFVWEEFPPAQYGSAAMSKHGLEFQVEQVEVTTLHYSKHVASLAIGYNLGTWRLVSLTSLQVEFSSSYSSLQRSVAGICFQEPENDPRNYVYYWVLRGNKEEREDQSYAIASLYSLTYKNRQSDLICADEENEVGLYSGLESVSLRFEHVLGGGEAPARSTWALALYTLELAPHQVSPGGANTSGNLNNNNRDSSDVEAQGLDLGLSVFMWQAREEPDMDDDLGKKSSPVTYLGIFDVNVWYQAQMPSSCDSGELCSYFTYSPLNCGPDHRLTSCLLDMRVAANTVSRFSGAGPILEQHYFPSSLKFDLVLLTKVGHITASHIGLQRFVLRELSARSGSALVQPSQLHQLCLVAGLAHGNAMEPSLLAQREILLNVLLEQNLVGVIVSAAGEWADGRYSKAGCSLKFLLDWAWRRLVGIKERLDASSVCLFDGSVVEANQEVRQLLGFLGGQLTQIVTVMSAVAAVAGTVTQVGLEELECRQNVTGLVLLYTQAIGWFVNVGLLPERPDGDETGLNPFPVDFLVTSYRDKRRRMAGLPRYGQPVQLMVDILCEDIGDELIESFQKGGGAGDYPPPTLHALLALFLTDRPAPTKLRLVQYFFLDLAQLLSTDNNGHADAAGLLENLIKFPSAFSLPPSLIKLTQAFWLLDHEDWEEAVAMMLDPLLQEDDLSVVHHRAILRTLLAHDQNVSALKYTRIRRPPILTPDDMHLHISVLLKNGAIQEAYTFQRTRSGSDNNADLLQQFFLRAEELGKLDSVLQLSLSRSEEAAFLTFLQQSKRPDSQEILLLYYLQRSRYSEARQLHETLQSQGGGRRTTGREAIMARYSHILPVITSHNPIGVGNNNFRSFGNRPVPLSVTHGEKNITIQRSWQTFQSRLATPARTLPSHTPFRKNRRSNENQLSTSIGLQRYESVKRKLTDFPPLSFPSETVVDGHEDASLSTGKSELVTPPSKRTRLSEVTSLSMASKSFKSHSQLLSNPDVMAVLQTPTIRRRTASSAFQEANGLSARRGSQQMHTPQSILKVKTLMQEMSPALDEGDYTPVAAVRAEERTRETTPGKSIRFQVPKKLPPPKDATPPPGEALTTIFNPDMESPVAELATSSDREISFQVPIHRVDQLPSKMKIRKVSESSKHSSDDSFYSVNVSSDSMMDWTEPMPDISLPDLSTDQSSSGASPGIASRLDDIGSAAKLKLSGVEKSVLQRTDAQQNEDVEDEEAILTDDSDEAYFKENPRTIKKGIEFESLDESELDQIKSVLSESTDKDPTLDFSWEVDEETKLRNEKIYQDLLMSAKKPVPASGQDSRLLLQSTEEEQEKTNIVDEPGKATSPEVNSPTVMNTTVPVAPLGLSFLESDEEADPQASPAGKGAVDPVLPASQDLDTTAKQPHLGMSFLVSDSEDEDKSPAEDDLIESGAKVEATPKNTTGQLGMSFLIHDSDDEDADTSQASPHSAKQVERRRLPSLHFSPSVEVTLDQFLSEAEGKVVEDKGATPTGVRRPSYSYDSVTTEVEKFPKGGLKSRFRNDRAVDDEQFEIITEEEIELSRSEPDPEQVKANQTTNEGGKADSCKGVEAKLEEVKAVLEEVKAVEVHADQEVQQLFEQAEDASSEALERLSTTATRASSVAGSVYSDIMQLPPLLSPPMTTAAADVGPVGSPPVTTVREFTFAEAISVGTSEEQVDNIVRSVSMREPLDESQTEDMSVDEKSDKQEMMVDPVPTTDAITNETNVEVASIMVNVSDGEEQQELDVDEELAIMADPDESCHSSGGEEVAPLNFSWTAVKPPLQMSIKELIEQEKEDSLNFSNPVVEGEEDEEPLNQSNLKFNFSQPLDVSMDEDGDDEGPEEPQAVEEEEPERVKAAADQLDQEEEEEDGLELRLSSTESSPVKQEARKREPERLVQLDDDQTRSSRSTRKTRSAAVLETDSFSTMTKSTASRTSLQGLSPVIQERRSSNRQSTPMASMRLSSRMKAGRVSRSVRLDKTLHDLQQKEMEEQEDETSEATAADVPASVKTEKPASPARSPRKQSSYVSPPRVKETWITSQPESSDAAASLADNEMAGEEPVGEPEETEMKEIEIAPVVRNLRSAASSPSSPTTRSGRASSATSHAMPSRKPRNTASSSPATPTRSQRGGTSSNPATPTRRSRNTTPASSSAKLAKKSASASPAASPVNATRQFRTTPTSSPATASRKSRPSPSPAKAVVAMLTRAPASPVTPTRKSRPNSSPFKVIKQTPTTPAASPRNARPSSSSPAKVVKTTTRATLIASPATPSRSSRSGSSPAKALKQTRTTPRASPAASPRKSRPTSSSPAKVTTRVAPAASPATRSRSSPTKAGSPVKASKPSLAPAAPSPTTPRGKVRKAAVSPAAGTATPSRRSRSSAAAATPATPSRKATRATSALPSLTESSSPEKSTSTSSVSKKGKKGSELATPPASTEKRTRASATKKVDSPKNTPRKAKANQVSVQVASLSGTPGSKKRARSAAPHTPRGDISLTKPELLATPPSRESPARKKTRRLDELHTPSKTGEKEGEGSVETPRASSRRAAAVKAVTRATLDVSPASAKATPSKRGRALRSVQPSQEDGNDHEDEEEEETGLVESPSKRTRATKIQSEAAQVPSSVELRKMAAGATRRTSGRVSRTNTPTGSPVKDPVVEVPTPTRRSRRISGADALPAVDTPTRRSRRLSGLSDDNVSTAPDGGIIAGSSARKGRTPRSARRHTSVKAQDIETALGFGTPVLEPVFEMEEVEHALGANSQSGKGKKKRSSGNVSSAADEPATTRTRGSRSSRAAGQPEAGEEADDVTTELEAIAAKDGPSRKSTRLSGRRRLTIVTVGTEVNRAFSPIKKSETSESEKDAEEDEDKEPKKRYAARKRRTIYRLK